MSKKVISLLLAVMLTAAMIVVAAISVSADTDDEGSYVPSEGTETYHIYFCKPDDWENKYTSDAGVYWENGSDTPSAWPGYSARKADIKNVYCSDVPTDVDKVIWNNALKGTDDPTNPECKLAYRTTDINFKGYDKGESDYYPNGVESFDNMIYIINPEFTSENDKDELIFTGEWFYYYGNGEYGNAPKKADLKVGDYYGKNGVFPTEYNPSGEETTAESTTEVVTESETTESATDGAAATEGTTSSAESSLALTVNATSNYFPMASAKYNAVTNQVTVTYIMQSPKNVLDTQWHISYDPSILSVADVNTAKSVCPTMDGRGVYVNFKNKSEGVGYVRFGASNLGLYDFNEKTLFATVVFDVKDISKVAPVSTTVDLVVEVLRVSEVNTDTEMTDGSKEVILVDKEVVKKDSVAVAAKNDLSTELTPSTYAEPTTAEPSTAESSTEETTSTEATKATEETQESTKVTIAPVTSQDATSVTQPVTKKINSTSDTPDTSDNSGGNDGVVQTGEAPLAVVILTLLIGSTCVMFVLRKKEEIL
nr:hypothetical protein [Ruminococcus bromii]